MKNKYTLHKIGKQHQDINIKFQFIIIDRIKVLSQELGRMQVTVLKVFSTFRVGIATMLELNLSKMSLAYCLEAQQIRTLSWIEYFIKSVKIQKVLMKDKQTVKIIRSLSQSMKASPLHLIVRFPRHQLILKYTRALSSPQQAATMIKGKIQQ